jgi:hypothetical protein
MDEILRKRVKALYSFLKAFNQLRNPTIIHVDQHPTSYRILDLPQHSNIKILPRVWQNSETKSEPLRAKQGVLDILEVDEFQFDDQSVIA